jgi:hypothetical protein
MSFATAEAGLQIIDEMIRIKTQKTQSANEQQMNKECGPLFDTKTRHGPGAFNADWTPLHMFV